VGSVRVGCPVCALRPLVAGPQRGLGQ
jgi:hypothetical protein